MPGDLSSDTPFVLCHGDSNSQALLKHIDASQAHDNVNKQLEKEHTNKKACDFANFPGKSTASLHFTGVFLQHSSYYLTTSTRPSAKTRYPYLIPPLRAPPNRA